MRTFGLGIVLAATVLMAPQAWAQRGPGGAGRGGFDGGGLMLLSQDSVQKELKLSDEQVKQLDEQIAKQREAFSGLRDLSAEERLEQFNKAREEGQKAVASVLDEEQQKRYRQITLQVQGGAALASVEVADKLGLSAEQKSKVADIQANAREEMRGLFQGGDGDREAMRKKFQEARQATDDKLKAVLTDEQKTKWQEMLGEPFKGEMRPTGQFQRRRNRDGAAVRPAEETPTVLTADRDDDDKKDDKKPKAKQGEGSNKEKNARQGHDHGRKSHGKRAGHDKKHGTKHAGRAHHRRPGAYHAMHARHRHRGRHPGAMASRHPGGRRTGNHVAWAMGQGYGNRGFARRGFGPPHRQFARGGFHGQPLHGFRPPMGRPGSFARHGHRRPHGNLASHRHRRPNRHFGGHPWGGSFHGPHHLAMGRGGMGHGPMRHQGNMSFGHGPHGWHHGPGHFAARSRGPHPPLEMAHHRGPYGDRGQRGHGSGHRDVDRPHGPPMMHGMHRPPMHMAGFMRHFSHQREHGWHGGGEHRPEHGHQGPPSRGAGNDDRPRHDSREHARPKREDGPEGRAKKPMREGDKPTDSQPED